MYFGHQQVMSACCKAGRAAKRLLGFVGRCGVPRQRHAYPPRADTHRELAELLPARRTRGSARLETSAFHSSLGTGMFSPARPISSSPPVQLFLFLWKIQVVVPKHRSHAFSFTAPFLESVSALAIQRLQLVLRELCQLPTTPGVNTHFPPFGELLVHLAPSPPLSPFHEL